MTDEDPIPERVQTRLREEGIIDPQITGIEVAGLDESVLMHGPPGTGKTFESLGRSISRGDEQGFGPDEMTVVTYRRSLADEMIDRVVDWNAYQRPDLPLTDPESRFHYWGTINAVAARATRFFDTVVEACRGEMLHGLAGMMDETAAQAFCNHVGIQCEPAAPWFETPWTMFKALYDYAKNNLLDVGEYRYLDSHRLTSLRSDIRADRLLDEFNSHWSEPFSEVVRAYERWKHENDVHDFYEQLEAGLVGELPRMRHLVIDEYHDAYPLMAALCERWVEEADVAIVAGDPDQVVNAYAGADPRFFERLPDRVSKPLHSIELSRSYRCPDEHFAAAARVLSQERNPPRLRTNGVGEIREYQPPSIEQGSSGSWLLPDPEASGTPVFLWSQFGPEILFLARTRAQIDGIGAHLDEQGIVYGAQSGVAGDWEYRLTLMRALRLVDQVRPVDQASFDQEEARQYSPVANKRFSPDEAWLLLRHCDRSVFHDYSGLESLIRDCQTEMEPVPVPLSEWQQYIRSGWWDRYANGQASISHLTTGDYLSERDKRAMSAAWTRYQEESDWTLNALTGGTRLLTVHASKGTQSSDVVLYDGVTNRIRERTRRHGDVSENEARCWYVGLTRASERLHLVRQGIEWTRSWLPEGLVVAAQQDARRARRGVADD